ncbi:transposase DNA-binding-containing protein, partial [Shigella boydii]
KTSIKTITYLSDTGCLEIQGASLHILNSLSRSPEESIPVSCRTWSETKAAYCCFSNDKVSANKIMAPHKENITERAQQFKRVLVLQDTTELNYSGQKEKQGVGHKNIKMKETYFFILNSSSVSQVFASVFMMTISGSGMN